MKDGLIAVAMTFAASPLILLGASEVNASVATFGCVDESACTMAELLGGAYFEASGVRFSDFEIAHQYRVETSAISLTALEGPEDPGPGFRLNGNGQLVSNDTFSAGLTLAFSMTTIDGTNTLTASSLEIGPHNYESISDIELYGWYTSSYPSVDYIGSPYYSRSEFFNEEYDAETGVITIVPGPFSTKEMEISSYVRDGAWLDSYTFRAELPIPGAAWLFVTALGLVAGLRKRDSLWENV